MASESSHLDGNTNTSQPSPGFTTSSISGSTSAPEPFDPLARGIENLLAPTVHTTTETLYLVQQSQLAVGAELERLVFQLQYYLEKSEPPEVKEAVDRMAGLARRLDQVNESFTRIQVKLQKIHGKLLEHRRRPPPPQEQRREQQQRQQQEPQEQHV